jgi:hypothetical protein
MQRQLTASALRSLAADVLMPAKPIFGERNNLGTSTQIDVERT